MSQVGTIWDVCTVNGLELKMSNVRGGKRSEKRVVGRQPLTISPKVGDVHGRAEYLDQLFLVVVEVAFHYVHARSQKSYVSKVTYI